MRELKFRAWTGASMVNVGIGYSGNAISYGSKPIEWVDNKEQWPVMQFTGLKDILGFNLYEKDVVYLAGYGDYICEFPFIELYEAAAENDIGKLLGNIYESPDLMS